MLQPQILWRDPDLVAVEKPAGLLSHPTADKRRPDLVSWLRQQIDHPDLVMHHRLDRETSGLLLFSLSARACAPLAKIFAERKVRKTYLAWVKGHPPRAGRIDMALAETRGRVRVDPSGKTAITEFRRQRQKGLWAALELSPLQGRKHQLRVHCMQQGWPIVGDSLYGGPPSHRLWLHAFRLELVHPISGEPLKLECPPRENWEKGP